MIARTLASRLPALVLTWALSAWAIPPAAAADLVLVAHKSVPVASLSAESAANLFLGKRRETKEIELTPIDPDDKALRERFYQGVANMTAIRVKAYWARLVFSAQGKPPRELPMDEALREVAATPGLMTYTTADRVTPEMKILLRLP